MVTNVQIDAWKKNYLAAAGSQPASEMLELTSWLERNVPSQSTTGVLTPSLLQLYLVVRLILLGIVHGDYRIGNLIFHPKEVRLLIIIKIIKKRYVSFVFSCTFLYHT